MLLKKLLQRKYNLDMEDIQWNKMKQESYKSDGIRSGYSEGIDSFIEKLHREKIDKVDYLFLNAGIMCIHTRNNSRWV